MTKKKPMTPDQERFRLLIAQTGSAVMQGDRDAVLLFGKEMINVGARLPEKEVVDLIGGWSPDRCCKIVGEEVDLKWWLSMAEGFATLKRQ
jgi:hypothetical protein